MSFETKFELFEDSLSNLSSIVSECKNMTQNDTTRYDNVFRNAYLLTECNEIDHLVQELSNKITNIKNMLMADKISPDDENYECLVNEKITENNKQKRFMEMFGPYMFLYMNNEINNDNMN